MSDTAPVVTETVAPVTEAPAIVGETPPVEAAPVAETAPETTETVPNRYEKTLEKLMSSARDTRRKQQEEAQQRQALEFSQRVQQAAQYGPDAVLKALGLEQPKMSLAEILGEEDDGTPPTVKELKAKVAKLEEFINGHQEKEQTKAQQEQQHQMQQWQAQELGKIESFLGGNKEKYEFTATLAPVGSTNDLYNGIIGMYQQGYTPSYDDVAELVENRIEDLLDRLSTTKKFQSWASSKLKAQSAPPAQSAPTLRGTLNADSVTSTPPDNETDEQNLQRALQAAHAAREAALRQIQNAK